MTTILNAAQPLAILKQRTAPLHQEAERTITLFNQGVTVAEYSDYLKKMLGFYEPMEERLRAVEGFANELADVEDRWKAQNLRDDLWVMGTSEWQLPAIRRSGRVPAIRSAAEAWGCWYVLEGTTLGGQILLRHLAPRLGITSVRGGRFLAGYGGATGARWNTFRRSLEGAIQTPEKMETAAQAAEATFDSLLRWLKGEENGRGRPTTGYQRDCRPQ